MAGKGKHRPGGSARGHRTIADLFGGEGPLMPVGTCKLFLRKKALVRSHFMPAAMYKYVRRGSRSSSDHPVVMGRRLTSMTPYQVRGYLLCGDCEDRFNKNGEKYALQWVWNGKDFPLYERLKLALPRRFSNQYVAFSGKAIGVDTEKLAYFGLSLLWRAGVHTWNTAFGEKSNRMELGEFEDPIRRYLVGEDPFPPNTYVILTVCSDSNSQRYFYMPRS